MPDLPPDMVQGHPAGPETVLSLVSITKRFGALTANDAISFDLKRGEIVALLGENGAGKTTLMNILFGHYVADEGKVTAFGRPLAAGIGMVHQHFTLADNLTVLDNIMLGARPLFAPGLAKGKARARLRDISGRFGLQVAADATVGALTVGERQRVEILKALYRDARVLILDEPTAVLTPQEVDALFGTLRMLVAEGLSVIFISHKLNEVMAVSDRVLVLRGGRLAGERRTADTNRAELAALMVGQEVKPPKVGASLRGGPVLELKNVTTQGGVGGAPLNDITLAIRKAEITGIAGVSGNGQAALAAVIAGTLKPRSGEILIGAKSVADWSPGVALAHGIGRIPEDRHAEGMIGDMSVAENVISERYRSGRFSRAGFLSWRAARRFAGQIIADYDVKCPSPDARVRLLSGGNMQKLILGRALDGDPPVILANQPTRGLDVGAVAYVHEKLLAARARGAGVLLISEDLDELQALSDRIVVMFRGRLSDPSARGELTVAQLGERMAGHFEAGAKSHAA